MLEGDNIHAGMMSRTQKKDVDSRDFRVSERSPTILIFLSKPPWYR